MGSADDGFGVKFFPCLLLKIHFSEKRKNCPIKMTIYLPDTAELQRQVNNYIIWLPPVFPKGWLVVDIQKQVFRLADSDECKL